MQNFARNVDVLTQGLKAGISGLMNLANQGSDPASGVFFVNFNQDCTYVSLRLSKYKNTNLCYHSPLVIVSLFLHVINNDKP